jgi:prepilin-type N-terminal cleavage/methylation domain-containing protein
MTKNFFLKLKKGFTLVELLVVMGVLAVLAAGLVAIINPADRINLANDTKVFSDLNQMVDALQAYAANNSGSYPAITGATAANFDAVYTAVSNELSAKPTAVSGLTYSYNCTTAACKVSVQLKSKKYVTGTNTFAGACWTTTGGITTIASTSLDLVGVDTGSTCP